MTKRNDCTGTFEASSGNLRMKFISSFFGPIESDVELKQSELTRIHPHFGPVMMSFDTSDPEHPLKGMVAAYHFLASS